MRYEYKESIKNAVNEVYSASFVDEENRKNELDHVYRRATKVDEYEAKAKAFDEIFKLYIGYEDGWMSFPRGHKSFNKAVIDVCKQYESGDSE